jgi:hypothetical protein
MSRQASERSAEQVQRDLLIRIRTEGATAAYEAALAICKDPNAPPQARANSSNTILRAGGYFEKAEDGADKPPSEMTMAEIQAQLANLEGTRRRLLQEGRYDEDDPGIFD